MWTGQLHAAAEAAGPEPADQLVGPLRRAGLPPAAATGTAAAGSSMRRPSPTPGTVAHDRTVAHKQRVLAWLRELAQRAGAERPEQLARSLALLLDGALSSGALDADPEAAEAARATAAQLVRGAVGT